MRRRALLLTALTICTGASSALGDIIRLLDGSETRGTIKELVFKDGETPGIYPRNTLSKLTTSVPPKATLVLSGGRQFEGEIVSLRILTQHGVLSFTGSRIHEVELTGEGMVSEEELRQKALEGDPTHDELPEELEGYTRAVFLLNKEIWESYESQVSAQKVKEEDALRSRYRPNREKLESQCDAVKRTVWKKLGDYEKAKQNYSNQVKSFKREYIKTKGKTNRKPPNKPGPPGGLAEDKTKYESLRSQIRKLDQDALDQRERIEGDARERMKQINAVYYEHRQSILDGKKLTEEGMITKYAAAMKLPEKPKPPPKPSPEPAPKPKPKPAAKPAPRTVGKVTASHNGGAAALAIDGKADTRWDSKGTMKGGEWFALELPTEKEITRVTLDTRDSKDDYPRSYQVFVSKDGKQWGRPVASGKGNGPVTAINLKSARGKFIKIVQTGKSDKNYWSIHELTVATK